MTFGASIGATDYSKTMPFLAKIGTTLFAFRFASSTACFLSFSSRSAASCISTLLDFGRLNLREISC
jgi:hypothetical protein